MKWMTLPSLVVPSQFLMLASCTIWFLHHFPCAGWIQRTIYGRTASLLPSKYVKLCKDIWYTEGFASISNSQILFSIELDFNFDFAPIQILEVCLWTWTHWRGAIHGSKVCGKVNCEMGVSKFEKPLNMKPLCSFLSSIYVYMYTFCNTLHPCFTICVIRLWELWWHHND